MFFSSSSFSSSLSFLSFHGNVLFFHVPLRVADTWVRVSEHRPSSTIHIFVITGGSDTRFALPASSSPLEECVARVCSGGIETLEVSAFIDWQQCTSPKQVAPAALIFFSEQVYYHRRESRQRGQKSNSHIQVGGRSAGKRSVVVVGVPCVRYDHWISFTIIHRYSHTRRCQQYVCSSAWDTSSSSPTPDASA